MKGRTKHRSQEVTVWDLLYVAVMIALVAVAALFVIGCDRIIGPDDEALADHPRDELGTDRVTA